MRKIHWLDYVVDKIGITEQIKEPPKIIVLCAIKLEEQATELGGST